MGTLEDRQGKANETAQAERTTKLALLKQVETLANRSVTPAEIKLLAEAYAALKV